MKLIRLFVTVIGLVFLQSCVIAPPQPSPRGIPPKPAPKPRVTAVKQPIPEPPPKPSVTILPVDISAPPVPAQLPSEPGVIGSSPELFEPSNTIHSPQQAEVKQSPVIVSLLDQSDLYVGQGEHARAAASLERGLRIEPRNAYLWSKLAKIRLQQKRYSQVESLAKKSNRFAQGEFGLISDNWRTIAESRELRGDKPGAAAARRKSAEY